MKDRLQFILARLQWLQDNYAIRSEGDQAFAEAKNELVDVIATYVEAVAPPPAIEYKAMTGAELAALQAGIVAAVQAETEQSDVTVLGAIEAARTDVLAAIAAPA